MAELLGNGSVLSNIELTGNVRGHKRKRSEIEPDTVDARAKSFDIRSIGETNGSIITLSPQYLLPRAHLPLSWLNPTKANNSGYSGTVHLLESTHDRGLPPNVLVASRRHKTDFYALERHLQHHYTVIRLVSSLDTRQLARRAIWTAPLTPPPSSRDEEERDVTHADLRRKRRTLSKHEALLTESCAESCQKPLQEVSQQNDNDVEGLSATATSSTTPSDLVKPTTLEEVFRELANTYLDTLYLSRTSLAYFVKGPLSRLRTLAFDTAQTSIDIGQLTAFLREVVLSIRATDQRLKEHIPNIVRDSIEPAGAESASNYKATKRGKWKPKRDRRGLLPGETEYIVEWWHKCDIQPQGPVTPPSIANALQSKIADLRTRETFLQVIITLEALSLEHSIAKGAAATSQVADTDHQATVTNANNVTTPPRNTKKPFALDRHLEALLDRLVIWHSLSTQSTALSETPANTSKREPQDELRDFCVDIVVPFYSSRIAKVSVSVCKKLGGPIARSPLKQNTSESRPGQPAKRSGCSSKGEGQRDSRSTKSSKAPPSLQRSATDSQIATVKHTRRDSSASVSLASTKSANPDIKRPVSSALHSLTRREIDLSAASAASIEKLRKRSEQEARVREAIAGIRKPDRASALQENAALVDAKFAQSLHRSRKPAHTNQRADASRTSDIHIQATPRLVKSVSAASVHDLRQARLSPGSFLAPEHASHGIISIPQTGHRERHVDLLASSPSESKKQHHVLDSVRRAGGLDKSPLLSRLNHIECTPSRPRTLFSVTQTPISETGSLVVSRTLDTTPLAMVPLAAACPNAVQSTPKADKSIYDVLGWNDEPYEALA